MRQTVSNGVKGERHVGRRSSKNGSVGLIKAVPQLKIMSGYALSIYSPLLTTFTSIGVSPLVNLIENAAEES